MTMIRNDYNAKRPMTGAKRLGGELAMMRNVWKPLHEQVRVAHVACGAGMLKKKINTAKV